MTDLGHLVFDVKAYGAVGDGTTDDTAAIDAAILAAAGGGIVWFPPGTYLITSTIVLSLLEGVTLAGAGKKASTILADPGMDGDDVILFDQCSWCAVEDLWITSASIKSGGDGLSINGFEISVERVVFEHQFVSIHIIDTGLVRLVDLDLRDQGSHGIWIDSDPGNDYFLSRIIADNAIPSAGHGIYVSGGDAIFLENCDFLHFENGLLIAPTTGHHSEWHFFTGAVFDLCSNDGIHIGGDAGDIHGVTFVNSWASSNANQGVYIGDGAGDLQGIEIGDSKFLTNGQNGIRVVSPANRVTISDSQVAGNSVSSSGTYDGVSIAAGVLHLTMVGNQAHNVIGSGTQGYGLHFDSGATDYVIVQANDFSGNATGGIENQAGVTGVNLSIAGNL